MATKNNPLGLVPNARNLTADDLGISEDDPGWMTEADLAAYTEGAVDFFKEIGILVPVDPAQNDPAEYP